MKNQKKEALSSDAHDSLLKRKWTKRYDKNVSPIHDGLASIEDIYDAE